MSVRQYIGARYVPMFYEGTNGSEWESGVAYEAMTIVTYLGNSYTSKKTVPAGIGNPPANPTYWVATGIFNEQIQTLIEEVDDAKNGYLKGKNIAIIGDSNAVRFATYNHWNEFSNANVENVSANGAQWSGCINQIANLTRTPDIMFVICGSNDINTGGAQLGAKLGAPDVLDHTPKNDGTSFDNMKIFLNTVRTTYPKCEIICLTRPDHPTIDRSKWMYYRYFEQQIMNEWSVPVIDLQMIYNVAEFVTTQANWAKTDGLHFSDEATERLEYHISNIIKNAWMYNVAYEKPTNYYANYTNTTSTPEVKIRRQMRAVAWIGQHCYSRTGNSANRIHISGGAVYYNNVNSSEELVNFDVMGDASYLNIILYLDEMQYFSRYDVQNDVFTHGECNNSFRLDHHTEITITDVSQLYSGTYYIKGNHYSEVLNAPPESGGYSIMINRMDREGALYGTYLAIRNSSGVVYIGTDTGVGTTITWRKLTPT